MQPHLWNSLSNLLSRRGNSWTNSNPWILDRGPYSSCCPSLDCRSWRCSWILDTFPGPPCRTYVRPNVDPVANLTTLDPSLEATVFFGPLNFGNLTPSTAGLSPFVPRSSFTSHTHATLCPGCDNNCLALLFLQPYRTSPPEATSRVDDHPGQHVFVILDADVKSEFLKKKLVCARIQSWRSCRL